MDLFNAVLIVLGLISPLLFERMKGINDHDEFSLRDLSKVLAILLVYYGVFYFYYKVVGTEEDSLLFYLLIKILLTLAFIFATLRLTPFSNAAIRLKLFPQIEFRSSLYIIILCFFLYVSFTVFLAVEYFPKKVELELRNLIVLKAINEIPFFATPALILTEIFAVVGEEIVFRYFAINALRQKLKKNFAIVISSLIWMLMHGETNFGIFVLGVLLGFIYYKTESLSLCIVVHFIFNFTIGTEIFYVFYKDIAHITFPAYQYAIALFFFQVFLFHIVEMAFRKNAKVGRLG